MSEGVHINVEAQGLEDVKKVIEAFYYRGGNLRPLMGKTGEIIVGGVTKNFEEQGRPQRWKARSPLTNRIYANQAMYDYMKKGVGNKKSGTISKGMSQAVERRIGNLVLSGSGELKNKITSKPGVNSVMVGSALPYARIHQLGGVIVPKRYQTLGIPLGNGMGVLRLKKVTIPARPYLVITNEEKLQITEATKNYIMTGRAQ